MKNKFNVVSVMLLLALVVMLAPTGVMAQGVVCDSDYTVQADDSLSTIAERYYGNVLAFPVIADANNEISASDSSYAAIDDPNVIEIGWKLCIPAGEAAQAMLMENVFSPVASTGRRTRRSSGPRGSGRVPARCRRQRRRSSRRRSPSPRRCSARSRGTCPRGPLQAGAGP